MSYHSYDEWNSERPEPEWSYHWVGTLKKFQTPELLEKLTLLESEIDLTLMYEYTGIDKDDGFPYYLVEVKNGEYGEIYGVQGLTLNSNVYKYSYG